MLEIPDDESWAVTEFAEGGGDARRTQRLVALASVLAQRPDASLPEVCGSHAMVKAAYRFFDNEAVEAPAILESHVEATLRRLATVPRVLYAVLLSRAMPEAPCTALLEPEEWQALCCAIHLTATPPAQPPTLREAVHWIDRLGGLLGRRGDGEPGVTVLWRGFQQLTALTFMYRIMRPPVPKRKNVGKAYAWA